MTFLNSSLILFFFFFYGLVSAYYLTPSLLSFVCVLGKRFLSFCWQKCVFFSFFFFFPFCPSFDVFRFGRMIALFLVAFLALVVSANDCNQILGDAEVVFLPQVDSCDRLVEQTNKEIAYLTARATALLEKLSSGGTCKDSSFIPLPVRATVAEPHL
jgi:hypothetical protein